MELRYLRDTNKREVDFVALQDRKPLFAVFIVRLLLVWPMISASRPAIPSMSRRARSEPAVDYG